MACKHNDQHGEETESVDGQGKRFKGNQNVAGSMQISENYNLYLTLFIVISKE